MQVTFAVSTWLWDSPFSNTTLSLFPKIKQMGFDAVEIPVEDPALIDVIAVKQALTDNDLKPIICGVFSTARDFTHPDVAFHKNSFDYLLACFDIANALDATFVAGPMYSAVGKARLASPEQRKIEWNLAVENLHKVCVLAQAQALSIALEPLNRFESDLINTADDVMRLISDINHPAAGVLLDGFHMNIEEPSMEEAVKRVGEKLLHVQVSENYRGTPGTGQTRWQDLKNGLNAINYKGAVSIESFTPQIQALAGAVCIWKPLAASQDAFAENGLQFLKEWAK